MLPFSRILSILGYRFLALALIPNSSSDFCSPLGNQPSGRTLPVGSSEEARVDQTHTHTHVFPLIRAYFLILELADVYLMISDQQNK